MEKRITPYEGEVVWLIGDSLVINQKGSNFGILRRDREGRFFLDAKELRGQTNWGKEAALFSEGREEGRLYQDQRVGDKAESTRGSRGDAILDKGQLAFNTRGEIEKELAW